MTRIQTIRKLRGLTQRQLSDTSGISIKTLREYEVGSRSINKAAALTVYRLANVLNCKIEDLLELGDEDYGGE